MTTTGGRQFGPSVPAAPMRHVDGASVAADVASKRFSDMVYAFLYLVGMVSAMAVGFAVGSIYSYRAAILTALALAVVFGVIVSVVRRLRNT